MKELKRDVDVGLFLFAGSVFLATGGSAPFSHWPVPTQHDAHTAVFLYCRQELMAGQLCLVARGIGGKVLCG